MTQPNKSPSPGRFRVDFQPIGSRVEAPAGTDLLSAARAAGVQLASLCGGVGICDSCKVRLISGKLSPPTLEEQAALEEGQLASGFRLACQAQLQSDVVIEAPPESLTTPQRLQVEGQEAVLNLEPTLSLLDVQFDLPGLHDLRSDDIRIRDGLRQHGVEITRLDLPVLAQLSERLRRQAWAARLALRQDEVVGLLPPSGGMLGLAVDIGTTKVAAYLIDLETGETLGKDGAMNPQIAYGEDVISRIAYANQGPEQAEMLNTRVVETLNTLLAGLCSAAGVVPDQVVDAVVVGNTAMHHLFLGLPATQLGLAPYVPALAAPVDLRAARLGLRLAPGAYVHVPPNIAGYVGADHVAMVLASGVWETQKTVIALDIGTNTEITLASAGRLLSCSCASGPVFEGAHIRHGMRAAPGAIERVQVANGEVRLQTIGDQPPVGICGSGILDAVAELLNAGVIGRTGRLKDTSALASTTAEEPAIVLAPAEATGHGREIAVSRKDVNEIQLAKAAIRAGIEILLLQAGIEYSDIDEVIVAGAFGTYIHIPSALRVGMFPPLPVERFRQIGNAAGVGARQMLVSGRCRRTAAEIARRTEYVELTMHPVFTKEFMKAMYL